jgi:AraC family transcriptional regulator
LLEGVVRDGHRRRQAHGATTSVRARRARGELVERARAVLAEHPDGRLSLAALAATVGCSPFHLARTFRASTGTSVHQYQLRLRLSLALDRLADGADDLSALALDLGFASHSHFTTVFRRTFGTTPSAFRRALSGAGLRDARKIAGD